MTLDDLRAFFSCYECLGWLFGAGVALYVVVAAVAARRRY